MICAALRLLQREINRLIIGGERASGLTCNGLEEREGGEGEG
jgi:hypothetical protein